MHLRRSLRFDLGQRKDIEIDFLRQKDVAAPKALFVLGTKMRAALV